MSRIFLSHSSKDKAEAVALRDWLAAEGWADVFLDIDPISGLAPGEQWQNALRLAADRCEAVLLLISPNWLGSPWCYSEFLLAKQLGKRLFPLLIGGVAIDSLPNEISSDHQGVDLHDDPQGYKRLKQGLTRAGLDADSFTLAPGRRPYPGLAPLTEEDAAIFFGREAQVLRGLDRLRLMRDVGAERVMVVLGASGAGKSSFLRAGLWPRLRRDDYNFWPLPPIRPERAALRGKSGLYASLEATLGETRLNRHPVLTRFPRSRAALAEVIATPQELAELFRAIRQAATPVSSQGPRTAPALVLVIDQGEELLGEEGRGEAEKLLDLLAQTLVIETELLLLLAIRSDAYPRLQADPRLLGVTREPFDLPPMAEGSLRLVIEGPAKLAQPPLRPEPALVEALLADATGQDALPLLAFTLDRLAREYGADGHLTFKDYLSAGGIRGAINAAVEEAFAEGRSRGAAPMDGKQLGSLLRQAFIPHLASVNEGGEFTRRIAYASEIPAAAKPVVDLLVEARLLTRDRDERGESIEVAHEALLREWTLLRGFLETDREFLVGKRQLADDIAIWRQAPLKAQSQALLSGLRLARAQQWFTERSSHDFTEDERSFVAASIRASERARQKRNALLAAAVGVLIAFSVFAGIGWVKANHAAIEAQQNAQRAREATASATAKAEEARRNEEQARSAKALADANAQEAHKAKDRAEVSAAAARASEARAQVQESLSLADRSLRETASGDGNAGWRTAMSGLPTDIERPDRPYVPKAEFALAKSIGASRLLATAQNGDFINEAAFDAGGSLLAMATRDGSLKLIDAWTGAVVASTFMQKLAALTLAFAADGNSVAVSHQDPTSISWRDSHTGAVKWTRTVDFQQDYLALTPDAKKLVSVARSGDIRPYVFDVDNAGAPRRLETYETGRVGMFGNSVYNLSVSSDSRYALLSTYGTLYIWRLDEPSPIAWSRGGDSTAKPPGVKIDLSSYDADESIETASFVPGADEVLLVGKHTAYVYDIAAGSIRLHTQFSDSWHVSAPHLTVSRDGKLALFLFDESTFVALSLVDGKVTAKHKLPSKIIALAVSADAKWIAAAAEDFIIQLWKADEAEPTATLPGHKERLSGLEFAPDGSRLVSFGDNTARIWDLRDEAVRSSAIPPGWSIADLNPTATRGLLKRSADGGSPRWRVWSFETSSFLSNEMPTQFGDFTCDKVILSRDGKHVALRWSLGRIEGGDERRRFADAAVNWLNAAGTSDVIIPPVDGFHLTILIDAEGGRTIGAVVSPMDQKWENLSTETILLDDAGERIALVQSECCEGGGHSFVEILDMTSRTKLWETTQRGSNARLHYLPDVGELILQTSEFQGVQRYHTSINELHTGKKLSELDMPLADYADGQDSSPTARKWLPWGDKQFTPKLTALPSLAEIGKPTGLAIGVSSFTLANDRRSVLVQRDGAPRSLWSTEGPKWIADVPGDDVQGSTAVFSGDGRRVVVWVKRNDRDFMEAYASADGALIRSIKLLAYPQLFYVGSGGGPTALVFDPKRIGLVDFDSGTAVNEIQLTDKRRFWAFCGNDRRLLTIEESGRLRSWDTHNGSLAKDFEGLDAVKTLSADAAGANVPVLASNGQVVVLNCASDEIVWSSPASERYDSAQLSPDQKSIALWSESEVAVFSLPEVQAIARFPLSRDDKVFVTYSKSGDRLVVHVRGPHNSQHLIDVPNQKELALLHEEVCTISASGDTLYAGTDKDIKLYDARTGAFIREVKIEQPLRRTGLSPDGSVALFGVDFGKLFVFGRDGQPPKQAAALRANPPWVDFSTDPRKLLVQETNSVLTLRDAMDGKTLGNFAVNWGARSAAIGWIQRVNSAGTAIAVRSPDNYVRVMNTADGRQTAEFNWDANIVADMLFSNDGDRLMVVAEKGLMSVWNIAKGQPDGNALQLARSYSSYQSAALRGTPDASRILAVDQQGHVDLYSLNSHEAVSFYSGAPEQFVAAAMSPDGGLVATVGQKGILRIWHTRSREILVEDKLSDEQTYETPRLEFSPDGRLVFIKLSNQDWRAIKAPATGAALMKLQRQVLARTQTAASPPHSWRLGLFMNDPSPQQVSRLRPKYSGGALVSEVAADSPALVAGVEPGDIVVSVEGHPVANAVEAASLSRATGSETNLDVWRNGEVIHLRAFADVMK